MNNFLSGALYVGEPRTEDLQHDRYRLYQLLEICRESEGFTCE